MDIEKQVAEVSLSPPVLPAMDDTEEILSREDVAWVDSCLVRDADILGKNLVAVKDALLDLISSGLNSTGSSAPEIDNCQSEMDTGPSPLSKQALPFELLTQRGTDLILTESEENDGGDSPSQVEPSSPPTNFKNVFQPNYKEFLEVIFIQDRELNLDDNVAGFSHEDIFKVWDLDVPDEEGELFSQLQKALAQTSPRQPQESLPVSDGEVNLRELVGDFANVDDLVSGIADLSL